MTPPFHIKRLAVIGLGLIGGSFARALRDAGVVDEIIGCGRNTANLKLGKRLGVIDDYTTSAAEAVTGADFIFLAVPILSIEKVLSEIKDHISPDAVITDGGSVKSSVVTAAENVFGELPANFVPGHPIAGSEQSGVQAAKSDLYKQHKVILTPVNNTCRDALQKVRNAWQAAEANVLEMSVEYHDEVLAATSHLPHLVAYSLVDTLADKNENQDIFRYAAGGFRDFTRIASSDPAMWHDIFIANKKAVLKALDEFTEDLNQLRSAVETEDGHAMMGVFTRAKSARDHFSKMLERRAYVDKTMSQQNVKYIAKAGGSVTGQIRVPGDKSISHRSIMLGSLAEGVTEVEGFLEGEDSLATLQAFRDMGVVIEGPHNGRVTVHGVGLHGLKKPHGPLYLGNSGTSMRLLSGLMAAQAFDVELTGDASLSVRPMNRVVNPLREMGAVIDAEENGLPPLRIQGAQTLKGIDYEMPMASAQVKSCLLLAGLYSEGETVVTEPAPTRDHTERMLRGFGYGVKQQSSRISVQGGGKLTATNIDVPSDISSATFFMVAACIAPNSDVLLEHVGINPTRIGVINILRLMGANLDVLNEREVGGEPVADIRVKSSSLKGIQIPEDQVPLAIDEFPAIFIAAACAEGETILTGAEELRVKESDRIQVMMDGLQALGVKADGTPDGACIQGGEIHGGQVQSHGDHRIAMSFAVASLRATGDIEIDDCANVATSFPSFVELANEAGLSIVVK